MCLRGLRLCLRVRGRRPLTVSSREDLREFYARQARWFAGERSRLLRKADIARARRVLDLGAGTGAVHPELARRAGGLAIAVDKDLPVLRLAPGVRCAADAAKLPFLRASFDIVFAQMFFLWVKPLDVVLREIRRVLRDGGQLVAAAEPDYGGLIEHPDDGKLRHYAEGLAAEGADIRVGRKLGAALEAAGFHVSAGVHPLNPDAPTQPFRFVPYFHFLATPRA